MYPDSGNGSDSSADCSGVPVSEKYAGQIAVVCIVPMTFCLATGLYKLYMVAADSRSIFYLAMIFFAAAYFITEYLLNLCMENASLQNIRQFFNTHKWVLILIFIAVLCRVPLLSQLPRWDSGEYYYRLILGTHHLNIRVLKSSWKIMRCADIRHWDSALYICRENLLFRRKSSVLH